MHVSVFCTFWGRRKNVYLYKKYSEIFIVKKLQIWYNIDVS